MATQTKIKTPSAPKSLSLSNQEFIKVWLEHEEGSTGEAFFKAVNDALAKAHKGKKGRKTMTDNSIMQRVYRLNKRADKLGYEKRKLPWSVARESVDSRQRKMFGEMGFALKSK